MELRYQMTDILPLLPIPQPPNGKSAYNIPCPLCDRAGSREKHLNINLKRNVYRCPKCGQFQGGVVHLVEAARVDVERRKPDSGDLQVRDSVQKAYLNQNLSMETRSRMWNLLPKLDNAIGKRQWAGKEYGFPVKSEHGWHLPSD